MKKTQKSKTKKQKTINDFLILNDKMTIEDIDFKLRDYLGYLIPNYEDMSGVFRFDLQDKVLKSVFNLKYEFDYNENKNSDWHKLIERERKITQIVLNKIKKQVSILLLQEQI